MESVGYKERIVKLSIGFPIISWCVGLVGLCVWAKTNITITSDVFIMKFGRLVLFTYVDENQIIGYYKHRIDTKQFEGLAYNLHTRKVYRLTDG